MSFQADYFDGLSARAKPVMVRVQTSPQPHIAFEIAHESLTFALADCEVQAKLGKAKRLIDLPNGGRLEAENIDAIEALMPSKTNLFWRGLHYLENHLAWVFASMLLTVFAGWLFLQFGVPKLAEAVAKATPPSIEAQLGEQVLKGLDYKLGYFSPSETDAAHKAAITSALSNLCSKVKNCPTYRLEFRDGGVIGANAFALPGGIMVVTDGLVKLAKNDTEIVAVLAHELGHVQQRHAFRQSLQGVLAGLIIAAITGDVSSVASGLPAVLMQMRYSREHELEADHFALDALQKACLPTRAFADILQRLEAQALEVTSNKSAESSSRHNPKQKTHSISEMLSSHPDTQLRIQPFLHTDLNTKRNCT
ncbi:MAG: M48 family metallopeptidase [Pseudomonadota bacterium]